MAVPNIFATATSSIPLSQLDTNFATAITLGSTALYLGNTTTSVAGLTLTGSAFNGTVGATTASTGAFTTVTATGGVDKLTSATGVVSVSAATAPTTGQVLTATSGTVATWQTPSTTNLASPGPIGNTTPSTGAFTTLSATSTTASAVTASADNGYPGLDIIGKSSGARLNVQCSTTGLGTFVYSYNAARNAYEPLTTYANALKYYDNGTLAATQNAYGLGLGTTVPSSGMGIAFPATQSASTDANTLDDYEEGTWTVTLAFGGGSTGIAYVLRTGTYVKVGSMVMARCAVEISSKGSSTGAATITGFPFTASGAFHTAVAVQLISWTGAGQCDIGMNGGTTGSFYGISNNNGSGFTSLTNTDFANTSQFYFTMVYSV
jgi:hypothetical protein